MNEDFLSGEELRARRYGMKGKERMEHRTRFYGEVWIAGATLAVTAAAAGYSAYQSNKSSEAQKKALEAQGKKPKIVAYTPEDPSVAMGEYYKQVADNFPKLHEIAQGFNTTDNADYQSLLSRSSPKLMSGIAAQGKDANRLLHAKLPDDVNDLVQRSAAFKAVSGGYGVNSGAGNAVTARDLGRTSLDLINQGSNLLGANITNTKAVNPYFFTGDSLMLTPQQFLSRDDSNNAYANGVLNQNQNIQYQNGIYQAAAASYNPTGAGISSALGAAPGVINAAGRLTSSMNTQQQPTLYGATQQTGTSGYYNPYLDPAMYNTEGTYIGGGGT